MRHGRHNLRLLRCTLTTRRVGCDVLFFVIEYKWEFNMFSRETPAWWWRYLITATMDLVTPCSLWERGKIRVCFVLSRFMKYCLRELIREFLTTIGRSNDGNLTLFVYHFHWRFSRTLYTPIMELFAKRLPLLFYIWLIYFKIIQHRENINYFVFHFSFLT